MQPAALGIGFACTALLVSACKAKPKVESSPALTHPDWNQNLGTPAPSARHGAMPHGHPVIAAAKPDKLDEAEEEAAAALAVRASLPAPVPSVPWNKACQVNRKCAQEPAVIPTCQPGLIAEEWGQLEYEAAQRLGQQVSTQGAVSVTPAVPMGTQKCAPGECCHKLAMNLVVDGRPDAVALAGQTCSGDDSALCCTLTAGLTVIATGKVEKAPPASGLKYQLSGATFCTPIAAAADTDAAAPHM
jgi:hypothetical protein